MGDTRIRYGLALGRQNNWVAGIAGQKGYLAGTDGLFAQANTAPDVTTGVLFYTANSAATTINDFKLSTPFGSAYNVAGLFEGKVIKIFFTDGLTTVSGSRIFLQSSSNTAFPANSWLGLIYHNSGWYETERAVQNEAFVSRTIALGGTNLAITVTAADRLLSLNGTTALTTLTGISGGYIGQRILLISNSGGANVLISSTGSAIGAGNIYVVGTDSFRIAGISSAAGINSIEVVKISDSYWSVVSPFKTIV